MLNIKFVTWDEETDGIAVEHDGEQVWQETSHDSWDQYFRHVMPRGVPVLLSQDTRPGERGEDYCGICGGVAAEPPKGEHTCYDQHDVPRPGLEEAVDDLAWLAERGALAGVAEILRERRRQVETPEYPPEGTDWSDDGQAAVAARWELSELLEARQQGTADIGSDEHSLRRAGALAAIEIDRLVRMVSGA